jgi:hypothetical protein
VDARYINGTVVQPSVMMVRFRAFMFFEFGDDGLIQKVVGMHNEGVVVGQLDGGPLYP